jgi:hypothetical protein
VVLNIRFHAQGYEILGVQFPLGIDVDGNDMVDLLLDPRPAGGTLRVLPQVILPQRRPVGRTSITPCEEMLPGRRFAASGNPSIRVFQQSCHQSTVGNAAPACTFAKSSCSFATSSPFGAKPSPAVQSGEMIA